MGILCLDSHESVSAMELESNSGHWSLIALDSYMSFCKNLGLNATLGKHMSCHFGGLQVFHYSIELVPLLLSSAPPHHSFLQGRHVDVFVEPGR